MAEQATIAIEPPPEESPVTIRVAAPSSGTFHFMQASELEAEGEQAGPNADEHPAEEPVIIRETIADVVVEGEVVEEEVTIEVAAGTEVRSPARIGAVNRRSS